MKLRYVRWIDSNGGSGWTRLTALAEYNPVEIHSIGWLLKKDGVSMTLVQSYDARPEGNPNGDNFVNIPLSAVIEVRKLRKH